MTSPACWNCTNKLLFCSLLTCSNRLLQFYNLHSLSWVDLHWSLINCRLRILGLGWYTPLVEVNQAIFAWSFRQISVYPRETISTLKIMRSVPASLALNLCLTRTNIDWQANSASHSTHFQGFWCLMDLLWSWKKHRYRVSSPVMIRTSCRSESSYVCLVI